MKEEKKITPKDIEEARVRLGVFLGMQPRVWLPGLVAFVAAILLLALATVPGIRKNGTWYTLTSTPSGSAVLVDGAYLGATPGNFFLPRGLRALTVSRPGFSPETREIEVKGRIFATLLFPRKASLVVRLQAIDPRAFLHSSFIAFSGYSLSGAPSAIYQLPLVLSDSLLALAETGSMSSLPRTDAADFVRAAFAASGSAQSARDALRASFIAAAGGPPSPLGLVAGIETLAAAFQERPQVATLIAAFAPSDAKAAIGSSAALKALGARAAAITAPGSGLPRSPLGSIRVGQQSFRRIPASGIVASGESPGTSALPYAAAVPAFALAETETTRAQWAAFLAANPDWKPENRDTLVAKGAVDAAYLADWSDSSLSSSLPVTGVSKTAAEAYCAWLSRFAPQGFAVVLPSEAMWETVCKAGAPDWKKAILLAPGRSGPSPVGFAGADRFGFADLAGNVWEWCDDSFFPFPAFAPASGEWRGAEFSVRGASWANSADSVSPASRGGFPASFSSPFLGFRPALVVR